MTDYYRLTVEDSFKNLASSYRGLDEGEATRRLGVFGKNTLLWDPERRWIEIIRRIFSDITYLLLLASASILIVFSRDPLTLVFLFLLLLLRGYISLAAFDQNIRIIRSALHLGHIQRLKAIVRRTGEVLEIDAEDLVPGDIVLLETGDRIPADGRVIASADLQVSEVYLTGQQEPVEKNSTSIETDEALELNELSNMAFMGTTVFKGRGEIVITKTGQQTDLGKVGLLLRSEFASPSKTGNPRIRQLNVQIALFAMVASGMGLLLSIIRQSPWEGVLLTAATIILAAVPAVLPAAMSRLESVESKRIRRTGANIKRPETAETLGAITTLCISERAVQSNLDYAVKTIDLPGQTLEFDPSKSKRGDFVSKAGPAPSDIGSNELLSGLVFAMTLMSYPSEIALTDRGEPLIYGGTTLEQAFLAAASQLGMSRDIRNRLAEEYPLVTTYPSEEDPKGVVSVHEWYNRTSGLDGPNSKYVVYARGDARQIANACSKLVLADEWIPLTEEWRQNINAAIDSIENNLMDAYAFSMCVLDRLPYGDLWQQFPALDIALIGLIGMSTTLEEEYLKLYADILRRAGIRILLLSIKSPQTVRGLGRTLGIQDDKTLIDTDLDQMTTAEIARVVEEVPLYAQVDPAHKRRIVQALQDHGHMVAVTGESASELSVMLQADVGISLTGSEENLAEKVANISIPQPANALGCLMTAIEEGRAVHDNILKIVRYLLSCNLSEIVVLLGGLLAGLPNSLIPLQILLLNMVINGMPALSLASEKPEVKAMHRAPYMASVRILNRSMILLILYPGLLMGLMSMVLGYMYWLREPEGAWATMIFASLGFSQIFIGSALRARDDPLYAIGVFSSRTMFLASLLTFSLMLAAIYAPILQGLFKTTSLSLGNLVVSLLPGLIVFVVIELEKLFRQKKLDSNMGPGFGVVGLL